jgi:hypothetical protein
VNALQAMLDTKVVCDSVIIAHSDSCKTLMALSYVTGGLSFRPNAAGEGLQLLEQEAFLCYDKREKPVRFRGAISICRCF